MNDRQQRVFDKFIVKSKDELIALHAAHSLIGAYIITGDTNHVGIHHFFYKAQRFKHRLRKDLSRDVLDANLCHNMICIGWDSTNARPILAHVVKDGLKVNATCYFTYQDQDVDYMEVFIPKNATLKLELHHNADQTAALSTLPSNRSKFSWGYVLGAVFKDPRSKNAEVFKQNVAMTMTDLFLNQPLRGNNSNQTRKFHCAHYAFLIVQVSMILHLLDDDTRLAYCKKYSSSNRDVVKEAILLELNDVSTPLGLAYTNSQINEINSTNISPSDVSFVMSRLSDIDDIFFEQQEISQELEHVNFIM